LEGKKDGHKNTYYIVFGPYRNISIGIRKQKNITVILRNPIRLYTGYFYPDAKSFTDKAGKESCANRFLAVLSSSRSDNITTFFI
jgi:hypothetical protein